MSRRSIIKDTEEELIQDAEVVMRWSKKRIVIATVLCLFLIIGGIYAIRLLEQKATNVLGAAETSRPQIRIPNQNNVEDIIDQAKEDLTGINAKNLIQSQPKIQEIINNLTNLTSSSTSAKKLICDSLCN